MDWRIISFLNNLFNFSCQNCTLGCAKVFGECLDKYTFLEITFFLVKCFLEQLYGWYYFLTQFSIQDVISSITKRRFVLNDLTCSNSLYCAWIFNADPWDILKITTLHIKHNGNFSLTSNPIIKISVRGDSVKYFANKQKFLRDK